jgi:VanZ family protein
LLALTFTLLVALIDEGHQAMVGSRHGCLADIGWDLAGAGFAGFVILAFRKPKPLPGKI